MSQRKPLERGQGDEEEATEETRKGQKEEKDPNSAREQEGGVEGQQGLCCGEANPNQEGSKSSAPPTISVAASLAMATSWG